MEKKRLKKKPLKKKQVNSDRNDEELIRLNKYLSEAGFCSRRRADSLIEEGKVLVDGKVAVLGDKIRQGQVVVVENEKVKEDKSFVLLAFHKPVGIVCTTDTREKDNIVDFIKYPKRIFHIGRLDKDSEGLILMTNNGEIVNKILRAGNHHEKEYIVTVNKPVTEEFLNQMRKGVPILDRVTRPCKAWKEGKYVFRIILTQGLNRQIRRMSEYCGYKVVRLERIRIMNIELGNLKVGKYRHVTRTELEQLNRLLKDSSSEPKNL